MEDRNIEAEYWKRQFRILTYGMVGLVFVFLFMFYLKGEENPKEKVCYDYKSLNESLYKINEVCGSTFITHKWGDDITWYVFVTNICDGKKCESKYYKVDKCLVGILEE